MAKQVTQFTVIPRRSMGKAGYAANADQFASELPAFITQTNAVAVEVSDNAIKAENSEKNAKTYQDNASKSATSASDSASTATTKAKEASDSALSASQSVQTVTTKAKEASDSASSAKTSEDNAKKALDDAKAIIYADNLQTMIDAFSAIKGAFDAMSTEIEELE